MKVIIIVSFDERNGAIGYKDQLYYSLKADMAHFRKTTITTTVPNRKNLVVMGRKTWETLPKKPLADRENLVMTNRHILHTVTKTNMYDVLEYGYGHSIELENIFIIGGERVYRDFLEKSLVDEIIATVYKRKEEDKEYPADTFFPLEYLDNFKLVRSEFLAEDANFIAELRYFKKKGKTD